MERDEIKGVFDRQKERMRLAIEELSAHRDTLDGERQKHVEAILDRLRESLADDEAASARL